MTYLYERILRHLKLLDHVLVEGVHVFHEPLFGRVIDLSCVVDDAEVSLATEVRLHELGVSRMRGHQLLHEGFVGGFGEPTLLVYQSHNTHWLKHRL